MVLRTVKKTFLPRQDFRKAELAQISWGEKAHLEKKKDPESREKKGGD